MRRKKSSKEITIKDVAREAGISYSTVSRVVNNKEYVKPATRQRVLAAMNKLGYQANLQARSLAGGRTNVIGLLVHDIASPYTGELIRGIDDILGANDYELMVYTTHRRKNKEPKFVATMARGLTEGLLIVLPVQAEKYIENLRERNFPYVLIDQNSEDSQAPSVTSANLEGACEAVEHLITLGHRRIGVITGWMDIAGARDRLAGYKRALAKHNIPFDPELVVEGDFTPPSGYAGTEKLLQLNNPPTAIFPSNDDAALGTIEAIKAAGLHVPEDISVIGFDDVPLAANLSPKLTTVRQPIEDVGKMATQMLLSIIDNPEQEIEHIVLPTELIIRESTTSPPNK
mgnify:CR=1 FL=1